MKIELLKKREDFLKIFRESILGFFRKKFSSRNYIRKKFIINDKLNVIYPSQINRSDLTVIVSEFKYHPKVLRRFLQNLYIFFAIRWPFEKVASSDSILIDVPKDAEKTWIFIPGNHCIRIIDIKKNRCFVFLKSGSNVNFIKSQVTIRLKFNWLSSPKIIDYQNDWYEEKRIVGLPVNRLNSNNLKKKVIKRAQKQLLKIYKKTNKKISIKDYTRKLNNRFQKIIKLYFQDLSFKEKETINSFVNEVILFLNRTYKNINIQLVMTHGDFQDANILKSKNNFWLIDWEYSEIRSIFYDALVFDLKSRFPIGLSERLKRKMNELKDIKDYLNWTGDNLSKDNIYYLSVFFLEDLYLKIYENSSKNINNKSEVLKLYLSEISKIQKILI